jgi:HEAT repeat protein
VLALLLSVPVPAAAADESGAERPPRDPVYDQLQRKIITGQASLAEVRQALCDPDIAALTNTVHGLYSMRWHRGVVNLLDDMWALRRDRAPEIRWEQIEKAPVRLALASTLVRLKPFGDEEYIHYLREHRRDAHEFHRAQVVVGLGFNAAAEDVPYIEEMAGGDNTFVAQSAITALGLMEIPAGKEALLRLRDRDFDDGRQVIVEEVLKRAYGWTPPADAPADAQGAGNG